MRAIVPQSGLSAIIDRFDGLLIDQGCLVQDEANLHPGALNALQQLQAQGTQILVLAHSSEDDATNIARLERLGVAPELYGRLLSTGQLMRQALIAQSLTEAGGKRRYFVAGTPDELSRIDQGRLTRVESLSEADAVMLLGLSPAETEDPTRVGWLAEAARRGLPLYTPKADVAAPAARGELTPGFALALNQYWALGGDVFLYGKPSARIYARCLNILDPIESDRIGSIGDQFPADIFGAREQGIEPILVGTGAGGLKGSTPGEVEAWHAELTRLCDSYSIFELTVLPGLVW